MAELILVTFLDGLMALLLVITAVYCWRLNKRIRVLQDSKSELAQIIQEFDISTQKATQSIAEIHEATSRIAENMQHKIDKANYVADDLQFMIEKGSKLAGHPESAATLRNQSSQSSYASGGGAKAGQTKAARGQQSEAVHDFEALKASRNKSSGGPRRGDTSAEGEDAKANKRATIESVLKRAKRNRSDEDSGEDADAKRQRRPGARLRSRAEQELFEALKSGGGN